MLRQMQTRNDTKTSQDESRRQNKLTKPIGLDKLLFSKLKLIQLHLAAAQTHTTFKVVRPWQGQHYRSVIARFGFYWPHNPSQGRFKSIGGSRIAVKTILPTTRHYINPYFSLKIISNTNILKNVHPNATNQLHDWTSLVAN